jgi:hypothetical protein
MKEVVQRGFPALLCNIDARLNSPARLSQRSFRQLKSFLWWLELTLSDS